MYNNVLVSVLMPVYNGSEFIREAIDSILNQTHQNFELIIIDDCSKDNTVEIVKEYEDDRIVLLQNKTNKRSAYSLNRAIEIAKGKYLARMDQDDYCFPERFFYQVQLLESDDELGICGTQIRNFGEGVREESDTEFPLTHDELQLMNLYFVAFAHTTVMMRKSTLIDHNLRYKVGVIAEDYSLWKELLLVCKGATLDKVLMKRRVHNSSTTSTLFRKIEKDLERMRLEYVKDLFPGFNEMVYNRFSGSSQTLRKLAINKISAEQTKFEKNILLKYLNKYNQYFLYRKGWRWYLRRIKQKLKIG